VPHTFYALWQFNLMKNKRKYFGKCGMWVRPRNSITSVYPSIKLLSFIITLLLVLCLNKHDIKCSFVSFIGAVFLKTLTMQSLTTCLNFIFQEIMFLFLSTMSLPLIEVLLHKPSLKINYGIFVDLLSRRHVSAVVHPCADSVWRVFRDQSGKGWGTPRGHSLPFCWAGYCPATAWLHHSRPIQQPQLSAIEDLSLLSDARSVWAAEERSLHFPEGLEKQLSLYEWGWIYTSKKTCWTHSGQLYLQRGAAWPQCTIQNVTLHQWMIACYFSTQRSNMHVKINREEVHFELPCVRIVLYK